MPGPLYNAIKGTTAGTPGTGAFTPNAGSAGFLAWSTVPIGWTGLCRYEDGSDWELRYGYWNGTTISRPATGFVASSSGSAISLTSAATVALVADGNEIGVDFASAPVRGWLGASGGSSFTALGFTTQTTTGTASAGTIASTNYLTRQQRVVITSATTANAQSAISNSTTQLMSSSTSGVGGWCVSFRFGCSTLPTGPRLFIGATNTTMVGVTSEPSALTAHYAVLGKDSTDTNMQLLVNSNAGAGTKTDTGIPLVAGGWYECTLWSEPGSLTVYILLVRLDTGDIFYGSATTDTPAANTAMFIQAVSGLSATTGTAIVLNISHLLMRSVS